jgi:hypothetical protein
VIDPSVARITRVDTRVRVDPKDSTGTPETVVETAEEYTADAQLTERRGTHNAWLDSDVEISFLEDGWRIGTKDGLDGDELSMAGTLQWKSLGRCNRRWRQDRANLRRESGSCRSYHDQ